MTFLSVFSIYLSFLIGESLIFNSFNSLTLLLILKRDGETLVYRKPKTEVLVLMNIRLSDSQKLAVIQERHNSKTAGHLGISKIIKLIIRDFTWPKLR